MLRSLESRIEAGKAASNYDIIKPIHSGQIDMPAKIKQIKGYPKAERLRVRATASKISRKYKLLIFK
ncbi:hypothetical protein [Porphyromonas gulae]|uniref:hypothetical protein n=1 Tax=Porphyromonas gulae TaxID=111105 RepID=UPI0003A48619|nr:hypothetical protein [Porphyromonas gulae]